MGRLKRHRNALVLALLLIATSAEGSHASSALAYCPRTGVAGVATDLADDYDAGLAAVDDCVANGGVPECCANHVMTTSAGCIALARGSDYNFGFGRGASPEHAVGAAIIECEIVTSECIAKAHTCQ